MFLWNTGPRNIELLVVRRPKNLTKHNCEAKRLLWNGLKVLLQFTIHFVSYVICSLDLSQILSCVSASTSHQTSLQFTWNLEMKSLRSDSRRLQCLKASLFHNCHEMKSSACWVHWTLWDAFAKLDPPISVCQIFCKNLCTKLVFTWCQICVWYISSIFVTIKTC
jgi:hypothetical protein